MREEITFTIWMQGCHRLLLLQGTFCAANWQIFANFDPKLMTPEISVNEMPTFCSFPFTFHTVNLSPISFYFRHWTLCTVPCRLTCNGTSLKTQRGMGTLLSVLFAQMINQMLSYPRSEKHPPKILPTKSHPPRIDRSIAAVCLSTPRSPALGGRRIDAIITPLLPTHIAQLFNTNNQFLK